MEKRLTNIGKGAFILGFLYAVLMSGGGVAGFLSQLTAPIALLFLIGGIVMYKVGKKYKQA